jgi:hypothetical protein
MENNIFISKYIIKTAGNDLYRIGLSHYRIGYSTRNKLFNPLLVF